MCGAEGARFLIVQVLAVSNMRVWVWPQSLGFRVCVWGGGWAGLSWAGQGAVGLRGGRDSTQALDGCALVVVGEAGPVGSMTCRVHDMSCIAGQQAVGCHEGLRGQRCVVGCWLEVPSQSIWQVFGNALCNIACVNAYSLMQHSTCSAYCLFTLSHGRVDTT